MNHVLTLEKYMSRYKMVLFERWTGFCYKMDIYLNSISFIFPVRLSGISLSWKVHAGGVAGHFG